ncbi:PAS domain S-box protein [Solidesulfovibrio sp. C21]|uniref:PAS domain S-box protein n=1 Tax=Solidesulfovibrio sp. C21 TaxID=3398613 RepID=UPI0039FBC932
MQDNPSIAIIADMLLANSPAGLLIYDGETGECVFSNQILTEIFGKEDASSHLPTCQTIESWGKAGLIQSFESTLADGRPRSQRISLQIDINNTINLEVFLLRFYYKAKCYITIIIFDTTGHLNSRKITRRANPQYHEFAEKSSFIVIHYDRHLCPTYANHAWEKTSGYLAKDILGLPPIYIHRTPARDYAYYVNKLTKVLTGGIPDCIKLHYINAHGDLIFLEYVITPEYDRLGTIIGALAIGRNLTLDGNKNATKYKEVVKLANQAKKEFLTWLARPNSKQNRQEKEKNSSQLAERPKPNRSVDQKK